MFCIGKDKLLQVIKVIQLEKCAYGCEYCDCKYGYDGKRKPWSEQNGCPELRSVIELLKAMTDTEYEEILKRNKNIIIL